MSSLYVLYDSPELKSRSIDFSKTFNRMMSWLHSAELAAENLLARHAMHQLPGYLYQDMGMDQYAVELAFRNLYAR